MNIARLAKLALEREKRKTAALAKELEDESEGVAASATSSKALQVTFSSVSTLTSLSREFGIANSHVPSYY